MSLLKGFLLSVSLLCCAYAQDQELLERADDYYEQGYDEQGDILEQADWERAEGRSRAAKGAGQSGRKSQRNRSAAERAEERDTYEEADFLDAPVKRKTAHNRKIHVHDDSPPVPGYPCDAPSNGKVGGVETRGGVARSARGPRLQHDASSARGKNAKLDERKRPVGTNPCDLINRTTDRVLK